MEIVIEKTDGSKETYELGVAIVMKRDENGIPRQLVLMRPEEMVNVEEHNDFMTLFVPKDAMKPQD